MFPWSFALSLNKTITRSALPVIMMIIFNMNTAFISPSYKQTHPWLPSRPCVEVSAWDLKALHCTKLKNIYIFFLSLSLYHWTWSKQSNLQGKLPPFDSPIWYTSIESFFQTPSIVYGFFLPALSSKRNKKEVWAASSLKAFIDIDAGGILPIFSVGSISLSCGVLRATSLYWGVGLHFMCTGLIVYVLCACVHNMLAFCASKGQAKFHFIWERYWDAKWFLSLSVLNLSSWWHLCCQVWAKRTRGKSWAVVPFLYLFSSFFLLRKNRSNFQLHQGFTLMFA